MRTMLEQSFEPRVVGGHSIHDEYSPEACPRKYNLCGTERVVQCKNDIDILECDKCGFQRQTKCSFDEDMS